MDERATRDFHDAAPPTASVLRSDPDIRRDHRRQRWPSTKRPAPQLPYLPKGGPFPEESVGLLYMSLTMHHDVIVEGRLAQLRSAAYWHLRAKLIAYDTGLVIDPAAFGELPPDRERRD